MPQVSVTIDGKNYRMACGEGEEAHLVGLATDLDARVGEMRRTFGEIGDMRLQVMAALTLVDELTDARERLSALEAEAAALRNRDAEQAASRTRDVARTAEGIGRAAERVERMAQALNRQPAPGASNDEGRPPRGDPRGDQPT